jgi:hypothetical protein
MKKRVNGIPSCILFSNENLALEINSCRNRKKISSKQLWNIQMKL